MSRLDKCPSANKCLDWRESRCDGCNIFTMYHEGFEDGKKFQEKDVGYWIRVSDDMEQCSKCQALAPYNMEKPHCPRCGRRMDIDVEAENLKRIQELTDTIFTLESSINPIPKTYSDKDLNKALGVAIQLAITEKNNLTK